MYEFEYSRATSLDDAASKLGSDEEAKLVAGGMTLLPTLKLRLAKPTQLIDLAAIPALKGISEEGDAVVIGAMTRHADVNRSDVVKRGDPGPGGDGRDDRRSRRCATAARSAARSPITTRRPITRRRWWR